ncbi:MAG: hypothetical protein IPM13_05835 [Phycisphaerales bacterium]|nr:hypothetical protein [Phycisphaerales bacterium]
MSRGLALTCTAAFALSLATAAMAQPTRADETPVFLFNEQIIGLMTDRMVDDMAKRYNLDEDQLFAVREEIRARFPQFFLENRNEIIRLSNDYLVAILGEDPPEPQVVADWAQRLKPLVDGFSEVVDETREAIRPNLRDEQQVQMDAEYAAWQVGVGLLNNRLQVWSAGGYDWETEWPRSEKFRETERQRREEFERAQEEASSAVLRDASSGTEAAGADAAPGQRKPNAASAPSKPKDEWEIYVENFIRRYKLDDAQQNTARRILASVQEQRERYLRRRLADITALERKLAAAQGEEDKAKIRAELERLQAPLERYFNELKERLDRLPSKKQRAEAARGEMERQLPAGKSGDKPEGAAGNDTRTP